MNERIKELAEQVYGSAHHDDFKFAELIVRECVEVSINNGCGDFVDIEQKLFKHFGVSDDE
jgi:hypothetical protein